MSLTKQFFGKFASGEVKNVSTWFVFGVSGSGKSHYIREHEGIYQSLNYGDIRLFDADDVLRPSYQALPKCFWEKTETMTMANVLITRQLSDFNRSGSVYLGAVSENIMDEIIKRGFLNVIIVDIGEDLLTRNIRLRSCASSDQPTDIVRMLKSRTRMITWGKARHIPIVESFGEAMNIVGFQRKIENAILGSTDSQDDNIIRSEYFRSSNTILDDMRMRLDNVNLEITKHAGNQDVDSHNVSNIKRGWCNPKTGDLEVQQSSCYPYPVLEPRYQTELNCGSETSIVWRLADVDPVSLSDSNEMSKSDDNETSKVREFKACRSDFDQQDQCSSRTLNDLEVQMDLKRERLNILKREKILEAERELTDLTEQIFLLTQNRNS